MQLINDNIIFGLDIGTRSIVGIVGHEQPEGFKVLASHVELHETRSMIDGQIHDIEQVAKTIIKTKLALEAKLGFQLKKACIAAAGRVLKTMQIHVDSDIEEQTEISQKQILSLELQGMEKAMHQINYLNSTEDMPFYCVGYSVTNYYLNDFVMKNLVGHKGTKIGADVLSTFLPSEVVNSLYKVLEKAELEVYSLTLEPIAAIEVAIPKSYRLLNIALIDIGAGTSDIAITKDGSIIAYGMIPLAGDEITESIVHKYLVDFKTAETIKIKSSKKAKTISFKDAIGMKQTVESQDVRLTMEEAKQQLAKNIADKVIELNGGHTTNAVFIVGGGGQVDGFEPLLAKFLNLSEQRVAIRGKDVLKGVTSDDKDFKKVPEFVTPVGICLTGLVNNQHDFVEVFLNDESIRIFNTNRLTVMDVVALKAIDPKSFISRRGKVLQYTLNGEEKTIQGEIGEPAKIYVNQKESDLSTAIKMHDYISILPAVDGKTPKPLARDIIGDSYFVLNGEKKVLDYQLYINQQQKNPLTTISSNDNIVCTYLSVTEILEQFDIDYTHVFINEVEAKPDTLVKQGDQVTTFFDEDSLLESKKKLKTKNSKNLSDETVTKNMDNPSTIIDFIYVIINKEPVQLSGKTHFLFVDIFDFYPFDRTKAKGTLVTTINGVKCNYLDPIQDGDIIEIYWKETSVG